MFEWLRRLGKRGESDGPDLSGVVAIYASVGFRLGKDAPDQLLDITDEIVNSAVRGGPPTLDAATLVSYYVAKVFSSLDEEHAACDWWAKTVELGKKSATPSGLEAAAWASAELSNSPALAAYRSVETAAEAVTLGEQSETCVGYAAAALGALYVGLQQTTRTDKISWWERAVAFGEDGCAPSGYTAGAAAALDIGMELEDPVSRLLRADSTHERDSAADWYRKSMTLGRIYRHSAGREYANQAASLLRDLEAKRLR